MLDSIFHKDGYDSPYIKARKEIDDLCRMITKGEITIDKANSIYDGIEAQFASRNPERADLFRMIYKSRVSRLCEQFLSGGAP